jgi:SAM-dependent methyltransferase
MLAPLAIPWPYLRWNMQHGAPFGAQLGDVGPHLRFASPEVIEWLRGPFQYQANNTSRAFEYPWAFFSGNVRPGLDVLEIGGGVSGFQFALARAGCRVTNVDPGMDLEPVSWRVDEGTIRRLNKLYGTDVVLRNTDIEHADLADSAFDVVFSISVLEHLGEDVMCSIVREAYRVLRPGGIFVLTIDLFLDVQPFSDLRENQYGSNVNVRKAIEAAPFAVEIGIPSQLHGFPEFDRTRIQARLSEFLIGSYPTLTQCIVLRKQ